MSEMSARFRGYLPVVIDLETGGFNKDIHGLLEIAAVRLDYFNGRLDIAEVVSWNVHPHPATRIEEASLQLTGIVLNDPDRDTFTEEESIRELFRFVRRGLKFNSCKRAIVTAHNAHFDHGFLSKAAERNNIKRNPFHPFSVLDTASLAAVAYGHTVLSEACDRAGIAFDESRAHSARYDAETTALLFCAIVNSWSHDHQ